MLTLEDELLESFLPQGGSGGPMMCLTPSGSWQLEGLFTHQRGCLGSKHPAVFTDVSEVQKWIVNTIGIAGGKANKRITTTTAATTTTTTTTTESTSTTSAATTTAASTTTLSIVTASTSTTTSTNQGTVAFSSTAQIEPGNNNASLAENSIENTIK